jgi:arsenate reductase (thioredoxin)
VWSSSACVVDSQLPGAMRRTASGRAGSCAGAAACRARGRSDSISTSSERSGRSQMATAFFNHLADRQKAEAVSAGTDARFARPSGGSVCHAGDWDRPQRCKPQKLTEELAREAQLLVTMGCGDKCPYVPGLRRDDWPLQDPEAFPSNRSEPFVMTSRSE